MTSNDTPAAGRGPRPGRRRALGRGPGGVPSAPQPVDAGAEADTEAEAEPTAAPPAAIRAPAPAPTRAPAPADRDDVPGPDTDPVPGTAPDPAPAGPGTDGRPAGPGTVPAVDSGAMAYDLEPAQGNPKADGAGTADETAETEALAGSEVVEMAEAAEATEATEEYDGRFKVRLSNFEGPFDLLLQLISKHKLDVTEVALSKVTDEFMAYIRALGPDWDLDETTEFLVVAATLLDLKAARLLPAAEVEDEADLALLEARDLLFARLLQYRAYKRIAEIFSLRLDEEARRHPRTVGLEPHHAELLPEVVISIGAEGFARLAVKAMQPRPKPQVYVDHIHAPLVSVQEQAGIVVARLRELGEASFRALTEDTDDTLTVVARFLALLELYREKAVALDQETALGELTVRWTGGDGSEAPTVTDEFDRPPEAPGEPPEGGQGVSRT
ncbi:segregation and condensation protein A [Streptomyces pratens]|uniref:Segregation and condensation protein A n=1 Tax=Streptomyces pratens TaxID=887456 RepID=A0ABW1M3B6_9ACTN